MNTNWFRSARPRDATGLELARQAGLAVLNHPGRNELFRALADADVVLVHWWNNPDVATLFPPGIARPCGSRCGCMWAVIMRPR